MTTVCFGRASAAQSRSGSPSAACTAERLIAAGRAPDTPVAVVENGTRPDQKVAHGRLEDLALIVVANDFLGPAVLIIGEAVGAAADSRRLARAVLSERTPR